MSTGAKTTLQAAKPSRHAIWPEQAARGRKKSPSPIGNELTRRLIALSGKIDGLPADLAEQHDHYLHGTPKRRHA
jgi:hypothetical protein